MNTYQKTTILVTATFLPLLLLFMKGMGYVGAWVVGGAVIGVAGTLVYALRNAEARR
jgi:hypothetical protein